MTTLFDDLLVLHPLRTGEPLWKMKLTWSEYLSLKDFLKSQYALSLQNYGREAALYCAEWYRREYVGQYGTEEDLCKSLGVEPSGREVLWEAAKDGASRLGLQIVRVNRSHPKWSILYQGGLPMNRIANEIGTGDGYSKWNGFFRSLVWDEVDLGTLSENDTREIPSRSLSLQEFCETLQAAQNESDAPWNPENCHEWWDVVTRSFEAARRERRDLNPFHFRWRVEMNDNRRTASVSYRIKGPWSLSDSFLSAHGLDRAGHRETFIPFYVTEEGREIPLAEYHEYNGVLRSRRQVSLSRGYSIGDEIDIAMACNGASGISIDAVRCLDLSDPKLFMLEDRRNNVFTLAPVSKLAEGPCRIVATQDWECGTLEHTLYETGGVRYKVFETSPGDTHIEMTSSVTGERKVFDPNIPLLWTAIKDGCSLNGTLPVGVREKIYDTSSAVFYSGCGERLTKKEKPVLYARIGGGVWRDSPEFGRIKAKIRTRDNESVDPVKLYNVGRLSIRKVSSAIDSCTIAIDWPHGEVTCDHAVFADGTWTIARKDLADSGSVPFRFCPEGRSGMTFTLHIIPPFSGFTIFDPSGKEVHDGSVIPVSQMNGYRYCLHPDGEFRIYPTRSVAQGCLSYCYSEADRNRLHLAEKIASITKNKRVIPCEGPLPALFYHGSTQIDYLLEKDAAPITKAMAVLRVGGSHFKVYFKEYPYKLSTMEDRVIVHNHEGLPGYHGTLLALPILCPDHDPVALQPAEEANQHVIPEQILQSDYTQWLVFGQSEGLVLPLMIDTRTELDEDTRRSRRRSNLLAIKKELSEARLFSAPWKRVLRWFDIIQEGRIPATSVLDLVAVADDSTLLQRFALHIFLLNSSLMRFDMDRPGWAWEEWNDVNAQMLDLQKQLSFLWLWAESPDKDDILGLLNGMPGAASAEDLECLRGFFAGWLSMRGLYDTLTESLTDLPSHVRVCFESLAGLFREWMEGDGNGHAGLREESRPPMTLYNPDTDQNGGNDDLTPAAGAAFTSLDGLITDNGRRRVAPDEVWLEERRRLSEMLSGPLDLGQIADEEDTRWEIRKSTIYGLRFNGHEV